MSKKARNLNLTLNKNERKAQTLTFRKNRIHNFFMRIGNPLVILLQKHGPPGISVKSELPPHLDFQPCTYMI
jgi:hypothetical protein